MTPILDDLIMKHENENGIYSVSENVIYSVSENVIYSVSENVLDFPISLLI